MNTMDKYFSVIMPTFNQCAFIRRAIQSLMMQTYTNWELIIVNDGCTDETEEYIADYLKDPRIIYVKNSVNTGLGHALNQGLIAARYSHIAYLPSDDYYFPEHLETIVRKFEEYPNAPLVFSGLQFDTKDTVCYSPQTESKFTRPGYCLQLVQVAHLKMPGLHWLERNEYLTEDLFQMFWCQFISKGPFIPTGLITCFWTTHPLQRHILLSERYGGGLNKCRSYYRIKEPIKIKVSKNKFIDEDAFYSTFRKPVSKLNGLKVLLVGELAYNPERIYALEEAGCKLYGLWDTHPMYSFTTVGHLPFGHVEDIPYENWEERVGEIRPDVIYGLLNAGVVPFFYEVVTKSPGIPYVWHFKEGPSICLRMGSWDKLVYLYRHASGRIFINEVAKRWYLQYLPSDSVPAMILDGDLPKKEYFTNDFSAKLSSTVGGIHTVVTGRVIGISEDDIKLLAANDVHIHLYTENYYESNNRENYQKLLPHHFHVHPHVAAGQWTHELSQYDAGWLHGHKSANGGNLMRATWDDLNFPARMATYAAAGLPILMPHNNGHIVACNDVAAKRGFGLFYDEIAEVPQLLRSEVASPTATKNMLQHRMEFSFDAHVAELITLFRIAAKKN